MTKLYLLLQTIGRIKKNGNNPDNKSLKPAQQFPPPHDFVKSSNQTHTTQKAMYHFKPINQ